MPASCLPQILARYPPREIKCAHAGSLEMSRTLVISSRAVKGYKLFVQQNDDDELKIELSLQSTDEILIL